LNENIDERVVKGREPFGDGATIKLLSGVRASYEVRTHNCRTSRQRCFEVTIRSLNRTYVLYITIHDDAYPDSHQHRDVPVLLPD